MLKLHLTIYPSGPKGILGSPGRFGTTGYYRPRGFHIVRHSQTTRIPLCPAGTTKLWDGYSLLYTEGNERAHHQDLGMHNFYFFNAFLIKDSEKKNV